MATTAPLPQRRSRGLRDQKPLSPSRQQVEEEWLGASLTAPSGGGVALSGAPPSPSIRKLFSKLVSYQPKLSLVTPITKGSDKLDHNNYQPISLLSILVNFLRNIYATIYIEEHSVMKIRDQGKSHNRCSLVSC